jgi:phenylacetate-CoA ligase
MGLVGRVGDAVKVRGMFVHPSQVREVMSQFPEITRYQAVVTRAGHRDELNFYLEIAGEAGEGLPASVETRLQGVLRLKAEVHVVQPGTIPEDAGEIDDRRVWD